MTTFVDDIVGDAARLLTQRWQVDETTAVGAIREVASDLGVDADDLAALVVAATTPPLVAA